MQEQALLQRLQHKRDNFDAAAAAASAPKRKTGNQGQPASSPAGHRPHRGDLPWDDDGLDASGNEGNEEGYNEDDEDEGFGEDEAMDPLQDGDWVAPSPSPRQNTLLAATGLPGQRINPAAGGAGISAASRQRQVGNSRRFSVEPRRPAGNKTVSAHGRSSLTPSSSSSGIVKVKADTTPVRWASANMVGPSLLSLS